MTASPIVRRVLDKLERVKVEKSGQWQARCPAHDDRTPSLSVSVGPDGKVLLHCHAGCGISAVLSALGLTAHDLFPERSGSTPSPVTLPSYITNTGPPWGSTRGYVVG